MPVLDQVSGDNWTAYNGDCVEVLRELPDNSIDLSVFSPPFASLYTYSNSDRDMGNTASSEEFFAQYAFLVRELMRVIKPGRIVAAHVMNLPTRKYVDGYIGFQDFRGDLIRAHQAEGWIYHGEVCIWKDPVTQMQRTKALGLLHKQLLKDSTMSRPGTADYVVFLRKPGDNADRVSHTRESFSVDRWQKIASPVWMDIDASDTLQARSVRESDDEKHLCPLQLEVIRRCVELYSNPGNVVLSPFMGIGSEGYVSLDMGRKFAGVELKPAYFKQAVANLRAVVKQPSLFEKVGS